MGCIVTRSTKPVLNVKPLKKEEEKKEEKKTEPIKSHKMPIILSCRHTED